MAKVGSLRSKVLIALLVVAGVSLVTQTVLFRIVTSRLERDKAFMKRDMLTMILQEKIKDKLDFQITNAMVLARNPNIINAILNNDVSLAEKELGELAKAYSVYDFKNIRVHLIRANMTSFYRTYSPKRDDDQSHRSVVKKVATEKKDFLGLEVEDTGVLLKAITPVFDQSKNFIGMLEFHAGLGSISRAFKKEKVFNILLVDRAAVKEEEYRKSASDVVIGEKFLVANSRWYDEETINVAKEIDYNRLLSNQYVLDRKYYATFQDALDAEGKKFGIHVFIMKAEDFGAEFGAIYKAMRLSQSTVLISYILTIAMVILLMNRLVINPIERFSRFISELGTDLTKRFDYSMKDEIGKMCAVFNESILGSFQVLIRDKIKTLISAILNLSKHFSESIMRTRDLTTEQVQRAEQIATAAEEMSQTIAEIARNSSIVSDRSKEASEIVKDGRDIAKKAVEAIEEVKSETIKLSHLVQNLNSRSVEIGDIVTIIKEIADQTNLLALNAAIEAARAGYQGRGFAVVADEVRRLAEKTIVSTEEIAQKIISVQQEASVTAQSMNHALEKVEYSTKLITNVGDILNNVYGIFQSLEEQIVHISSAVQEQSAVSEEVAKNVDESAKHSKEIDLMMTKVRELVESLRTSTEDLEREIEKFKV